MRTSFKEVFTMINSAGFVGEYCSANAVNVKTDKSFHAVDKDAVFMEIMEHILKAAASLGEDGKDIWDIVLRLEKHNDTEFSGEIICSDADDLAGLNSVAGLLARYWKKKELLGKTQSAEDDIFFSGSQNLNDIDNKAASELAALILKKKERKLISEV